MTNRIAPRRWGFALAALALLALLAGCATPATGTGSTSAPPAPLGETTTITTANGTGSFQVPVEWEVVDLSQETATMMAVPAWGNAYDLLGAGLPLRYQDGPPSDAHSVLPEGGWGEVSRRDLGDGMVALAYWLEGPEGFQPKVEIVLDREDGIGWPVQVGDSALEIAFTSEWIDDQGAWVVFDSEAEVVAALDTPEVERALDVMATLELHGPSHLDFPAGQGPEPAATGTEPFASASGAITLTVQPGWTVDDQSWQDSEGADWTMVTLHGPDGAMVQYVEEPAYSSVSGPSADAAEEVRATTVDGYEVVAGRERASDGPDAPFVVHVRLAEPAGGSAPPLCDDRCVSFQATVSAEVADEAAADALLASDVVEQIVATMASLERLD